MKLAYAIKRDYGAAELKRVYGKNLMRGLRYSLVVNLLAIGAYWGVVYVEPREKPQTIAVRLTKYEELSPPPSITDRNFGLSAYPVLAQSVAGPNGKRVHPRNHTGVRIQKFKEKFAARGIGEIRGDLPSAPGAKKIDPAQFLADNEEATKGRPYEDLNAVGAGGNNDEEFRGGTLVASKEGDAPSGDAHAGIGSNPHPILGGEGNNGGGQGGDADRFGSGLGDSFGYSMSWLRGGTRRKLSGNLPKYPRGVNVEAQISILTVVSPDGSVKSVQPVQKANTQLENAAMKELRYWKFEPLRPSAPQVDQNCVVTFNFKLK